MRRSLPSLLFYVLILLSVLTVSLRVVGVHYSVVLTDSMEPTINPMDIVVVFPTESVGKGDVVMYRLSMEGQEYFIVHRVVDIRGNLLVTKGDNRKYVDPWDVSRERVIGKVVMRVPRLGGLSLFIMRFYPFVFPVITGIIAYLLMATYLEGEAPKRAIVRASRSAVVMRRKKVVHYMRRKAFLLLLLMFAGSVLATPMELGVQALGEGSGLRISPVSSGQVCVPYEYYYIIYIFGVPVGDGTAPLDSVPTVYPGNFSEELPAGSEIHVIFKGRNGVDGVGMVRLSQPLQAGHYVGLNLTSPLEVENALNDELYLVVASSEGQTFSGTSMVLTVQGLGVGAKTGNYRDVRVYLGRAGSGVVTYDVFLDLRCFELSFMGTEARAYRTLSVARKANIGGDAPSNLELAVRRNFDPEEAVSAIRD